MNAAEPDRTAAPDRRAAAPSTLRWAARLLWTEAAGLAVLTAYLVVQDVTAAATDLAVGVGLTVAAALSAIALVALARGLARRAAGVRGPAVVVQLMLLVLGYHALQGGTWWLGGTLLGLGLATGGLIIAPPTTRALGLG